MAVLLGGVAAGCSGPTYVTLDGGAPDAPTAAGSLTLLSASSITIRPSAEAQITVRYTAGGAPVAGAPITVAIEGTALDATLRARTVTTDASGTAVATIVAGTSAARFRVRLSTPDASAPVYVEVGVGTSFGTLVVRAPYGGSRPVVERVVDLVPNGSCAMVSATPPASGGRIIPMGNDEVTIAAVPAMMPYAVLVRASSSTTLEAVGCVDGVVPPVDASATVTVVFVDVPLAIDGSYGIGVRLDTSTFIGDHLAAAADAVETASLARGGDGSAMLDAVQAKLIASGNTAAAASLSAARAAGALDALLSAQLITDGTSPTGLVIAYLARAHDALVSPSVNATLALAVTGSSVLTTEGVAASDGMGGTLVITLPTPMTRPVMLAIDATREQLDLTDARLDAPLGFLVTRWMDTAAGAHVAGGGLHGVLLGACGTLDTFAAAHSELDACDASCRADACHAAVDQTVADLARAATGLDGNVDAVVLSGSLVAHDDDGDARVDHIDGMLSGTFVDASGATVATASGTFVATPSVH